MAALLIKNVPPALHESLRARAERNHRSMTKEVLTILEHTLCGAEPMAQTTPLLRQAARKPLSAAAINKIIREGHV